MNTVSSAAHVSDLPVVESPKTKRSAAEVRIFRFGASLSVIVFILVVLHFSTPLFPKGMGERFNFNGEGNLPTWFSSSIMLLIAVFALRLWLDGTPGHRLNWIVMASAYLFLSADETGRLHEMIDIFTPIKWVFIYAPFALAFFIYTCRSLNNYVGIGRNLILGGMICFGAGGIGCEVVNSLLYPLPRFWQEVEYAIEESLEMFGHIMVLMGAMIQHEARTT